MPCWYYEKKDLAQTPSIRDGIPPETEARYRRNGTKLIMDVGSKLGLSYETTATAAVYFHRFYMIQSFKVFHRYPTAIACLCLAGKVEETPKKCRDLLVLTSAMFKPKEFQALFGENPVEHTLNLEAVLLHTLKYDLAVEHPYSYLLKFVKLIQGDKTTLQRILQSGWTFVNDSFASTLCLQWEPDVIAVSVLYLATRIHDFDIKQWKGKPSNYQGRWYTFFVEDVTTKLLEHVCHQILNLYSTHNDESSPIAVDEGESSEQAKTPDTTHLTTSAETDAEVRRKPVTSHLAMIEEGLGPEGHGERQLTEDMDIQTPSTDFSADGDSSRPELIVVDQPHDSCGGGGGDCGQMTSASIVTMVTANNDNVESPKDSNPGVELLQSAANSPEASIQSMISVNGNEGDCQSQKTADHPKENGSVGFFSQDELQLLLTQPPPPPPRPSIRPGPGLWRQQRPPAHGHARAPVSTFSQRYPYYGRPPPPMYAPAAPPRDYPGEYAYAGHHPLHGYGYPSGYGHPMPPVYPVPHHPVVRPGFVSQAIPPNFSRPPIYLPDQEALPGGIHPATFDQSLSRKRKLSNSWE